MKTRVSYSQHAIQMMLMLISLVLLATQTTISLSASTQSQLRAQIIYDGSWSGTTSQDTPISFTVVNNTITTLNIEFVLYACTVKQTLPINTLISDRFEHTASTLTSVTFIEGIFDSSSSVSGTASYTSIDQTCPGSVQIGWNATNTTPITATPTSTQTATSTVLPTATSPSIGLPSDKSYLPIVLRPALSMPTPTPVPTAPPGSGTLDGSWIGTTDQGRKIAFTITNHAFSSFTNSYKIGGCGLETTTNYSQPKSFSGNSFEHRIQGDFYYPSTGTYSIVTRGSFSSSTTVSGSMHVEDSRCGSLDATWTATKQ